jgi:formylglycine-generating enzyme required for sulfatase activity
MADGAKLKVFISYSRKDSSDVADELVAGLELAGFAPFLDRHDIAAGEDWETRLGGLIQEADTVVYVISPEAVKSERCAWEVDKTLALSKRLVPVIFKPVQETDIPQRLRRLQFIPFDTGWGMTRSLAQLANELRQDIDWIREHTRLGELAARWQARGKSEALLLRGDELDTAKAWVGARKPGVPEITEMQRALIESSDAANALRIAVTKATQRRNRLIQSFAGVLLLGFLLGLAWSNQAYLKARAVLLWEKLRPRVLSAEDEHALKEGQKFQECADCPEMVVLPPGEFVMGSDKNEKGHQINEEPQHRVWIEKRFAVSRFEITFEQWDMCFTLHGCTNRPSDQNWGRDMQPVINVNWNEAKEYVAWLSKRTGKSYRLLSEAEWEYAARAGSDKAYSWGNEVGRNNANCKTCGSKWDDRSTAPVGSFEANAYGLYNMHGNVFEWTSDCVHNDYNGAPTNGVSWEVGGDCDRHFVRGGGLDVGSEHLRSAERWILNWHYSSRDVGFRVAREFTP